MTVDSFVCKATCWRSINFHQIFIDKQISKITRVISQQFTWWDLNLVGLSSFSFEKIIYSLQSKLGLTTDLKTNQIKYAHVM